MNISDYREALVKRLEDLKEAEEKALANLNALIGGGAEVGRALELLDSEDEEEEEDVEKQ